MDVNWNEKILGLRIIDVRDFLIFIKFKGYYVYSIKELYKKIDCDWELFIKTLVKKNFINIVTNSENNKIIELTKDGISLTTKKNINPKDKSYCDKLIEEVKSRALFINNDESCPLYISKIFVFGSYLYKKDNYKFNYLDIIIIINEKKFLEGKDFDEKSDAYINFCDINDLCYCNSTIFGEFSRVNKFINTVIKKRNSFLHIQSGDCVPNDWKREVVFEGVDNSKKIKTKKTNLLN